MEPYEMTASAAARAIAEGRLTAEKLMRSCLERAEARDGELRAWLYRHPAWSIQAAREADKATSRGAVFGLPFGIKDMIDTVDMPTSYNSPIYQGHRPARDAACVAIMKAAGGILMGKTDTVEFAAFGRKAASRNPHNLEHTPGGSSSGSAAAVADLHVPIAFGTQTGGSHIRPASFCGIYAMKPSWSVVSREGARQYANSLDTIGWYGREVADLRLVASAFEIEGAEASPEMAPAASLRVGVCRSPVWSRIEPEGETALATAAERLSRAGVAVSEFELPAAYGELPDAIETVRRSEGAAAMRPLWLTERHRLFPDLAEHFQGNGGITTEGVVRAYGIIETCRARFASLFEDIDVILTPASPGAAPKGLASTGDHIFNAIWTAMHAPCVAMPSIITDAGLPVGVQLVTPRLTDARLLTIAASLESAMKG